MAKKTSGEASVPRILSMAFQEAEKGNLAKAMEFWHTAIERGGVIKTKTQKRFDKVTEKLRRPPGKDGQSARPQ